jgi:hypothetical protein
VTEAFSVQEPVRVQSAAADVHHRTGLAARRERVGTDLPGYRRRVIKGVVEAIRHDVQARVGGAGIG